MKYIITENKLNNTIKNFIFEVFPIVYDVYFTTHKVTLGSTPEMPSMDVTIINIIINNSNNKLKTYELNKIEKNIRQTTDNFFALNYMKYASGWDFKIQQLAVVPTQNVLDDLN